MMTCEPIDDRPILEAPSLVVEVLSPRTEGLDQLNKLVRYQAIASLREVWLVGCTRRFVLLYTLGADGVWHAGLPLIGKASFHSPVLNATVALDEIYALTTLAADDGDKDDDEGENSD